MREWCFLLVIVMILVGCTGDNEIPIDDNDFSFEIIRLEEDFKNINSREDALDYVVKVPTLRNWMLGNIYPNDSLYAQRMGMLAANEGIQELIKDVNRVFAEFETTTKLEVENVVKRTQYYYPKLQPKELVTHVSGYGSVDILIGEKVHLIGLDYFLGGDTKYPLMSKDLPQYLAKYYAKPYLVSKYSKALSKQFNEFDREDESVLAHMIYYGKELYFAEMTHPGCPDSIYIEYTSEEIAGVEAFASELVWKYFISNNLFFSTKPEHVSKYIQPRDKTREIADKMPGRIGQWLGWQIVRAYMEKHPEVTLKDLMDDNDAKKIFNQSAYKPKPL